MNDNQNRGVSWFLRVVLDKASAAKVRKEAQQALGEGTNPATAKSNLKEVDRATGALGRSFQRLGGIIAGVFALNQVSRFVREAFDASDRLEASTRRLGGTAKLTGASLEFLKRTSEEVRKQFGLAVPLANNFTTEVTKLTQKAGDISQTADAMRSLLDIGAARGLSSQQTLTAIGQAILGIDEGTDKLFDKNPSVLYAEFAETIGTTAGKLTDQQKAQAILTATIEGGRRTRGQYQEYLRSEAGLSEQAANKTEEMKGQIGAALAPIRTLALEGMIPLAESVGSAADEINDLANAFVRLTEVAKIPFKVRDFFLDLEERLGGDPRWLERQNEIARQRAADVGGVASDIDSRFFPERNGSFSASPEADAIRSRIQAGETERLRIAAEAAEAAREAAEAARERAEDILRAFDASAGASLGIAGGARRIPGADGTERFRANRRRLGEFTGAGGSLDRVAAMGALPDSAAISGFEGAYLGMLDNIESSSERVAGTISNAFARTFQFMIDEGATVGSFIEGLSRNMAAAVLDGISQLATGKVAENIALAIEFGARALGFGSLGNFPSASAAGAAAAQHIAAATAWGALAGGSAVLSGASTTGRSAGSSYDRGLSRSERTEISSQPITVYIDPFNPNNPVHVKQVGNAVALDVRLGGRRAVSR